MYSARPDGARNVNGCKLSSDAASPPSFLCFLRALPGYAGSPSAVLRKLSGCPPGVKWVCCVEGHSSRAALCCGCCAVLSRDCYTLLYCGAVLHRGFQLPRVSVSVCQRELVTWWNCQSRLAVSTIISHVKAGKDRQKNLPGMPSQMPQVAQMPPHKEHSRKAAMYQHGGRPSMQSTRVPPWVPPRQGTFWGGGKTSI